MKKILVFSNGEKLGDGIIKLPLLHEIKTRLPDYQLIWVTNKEKTAYNNQLKNFAFQYIDQVIEEINISPFFWKKISKKYDFENENYEYIFDTQKAVFRTIALKRIKNKNFISAAASGLFSSIKLKSKPNKRQYYLNDLLDLLDLISVKKVDKSFKIAIPIKLEKKLIEFFDPKYKYFGIAPGAGEKNRIWPIDKFVKVGKYFEKKNFRIVLYLGPQEQELKEELISLFPEAIIPEDLIQEFSNIETVISSTKFLKFAIANDSGIGHMLSSGYCKLFKLFGHHDSDKFTPIKDHIVSISSQEFNTLDIKKIPVQKVLDEINKFI